MSKATKPSAETALAALETSGDNFHESSRTEIQCGFFLALYLVVVAVFVCGKFLAAFTLAVGDDVTRAQGMLSLALLAGALGGFLHASQSLVTFLGNRSFRGSWFTWYLLRPWQGAFVGMAMYLIARAGLVSDGVGVNPFGVSALGLLGGWFSKNAMDKMREVFDVLLPSRGDTERRDKSYRDSQLAITNDAPTDPSPQDQK